LGERGFFILTSRFCDRFAHNFICNRLIIVVLGTGLAQIGAQESTKRLITGCVIVAAVILDHYRHEGIPKLKHQKSK